jgi:hypothetical protein
MPFDFLIFLICIPIKCLISIDFSSMKFPVVKENHPIQE